MFFQECGKKVKSLSNKWEKLGSIYSNIKKLRNQTSASVRDDGTKFIFYNQIDKIPSLTANANGVLRAMDQWMPVPSTRTSSGPTNVCEEANEDGEPSWEHPPHI